MGVISDLFFKNESVDVKGNWRVYDNELKAPRMYYDPMFKSNEKLTDPTKRNLDDSVIFDNIKEPGRSIVLSNFNPEAATHYIAKTPVKMRRAIDLKGPKYIKSPFQEIAHSAPDDEVYMEYHKPIFYTYVTYLSTPNTSSYGGKITDPKATTIAEITYRLKAEVSDVKYILISELNKNPDAFDGFTKFDIFMRRLDRGYEVTRVINWSV